jgi:dGTPase
MTLSFKKHAVYGGYAKHASHPDDSFERLIKEIPSSIDGDMRSTHQRDCDRIVHSTAFRRLKYKTQVFVEYEGDCYRTRLTHTLEVTRIARSLARALNLNEDLAEAVAFAHDLGHPPFGHAGEQVLNELMAEHGGFDHNVQALKIVTVLEKKYAAFDGLNLSWETIEGLIKHNGPLHNAPLQNNPLQSKSDGTENTISPLIKKIHENWDMRLLLYASAESQVAAIADDLAYNHHDLDDGIRADFFTIQELSSIPLVEACIRDITALYPSAPQDRFKHEVLRMILARMIADVSQETHRRLDIIKPECANDIRNASMPVVNFSEEMLDNVKQIQCFLSKRMYNHRSVKCIESKAKRVLRNLFRLWEQEPELLPQTWHEAVLSEEQRKAEIIADYIAGMTDRYALGEHSRMFDSSFTT